MDFGKIPEEELNKIDFKLPPDNKENKKFLAGNKNSSQPKVFVGCAKWGRPDWIGKIYPRGIRQADFLEHYAKQFNAIELNAFFYRIFDKAVVKKWSEKVGTDFKFCPKFNGDISHTLRLKNAEPVTEKFLDSIYSFGDKLGPCFLQLSDNFPPKNIDLIDNYLKSLPDDLEVFVEVRHKEWFQKNYFELLCEILQSNNCGFIITDAAGRRDCVHMRLTLQKAFIRFVGNSLHPTDYSRIDEWVERINVWMKQGIKEVYLFIHQHEELHSPELCKYTIQQLNKRCGTKIHEPEFVSDNELFR